MRCGGGGSRSIGGEGGKERGMRSAGSSGQPGEAAVEEVRSLGAATGWAAVAGQAQ
jgi:hypothetical protein